MAIRLPRKETPLKVAVRESEFSQTELARKCKVGEAVLSRVVNGLHPSDDLADKLAHQLRCEKTALWPHLYQATDDDLEAAA